MSESAAFPRMLTLGAAASMIGGHVTADVLRGEIKRGRLAGKRIGAKWYVSEASLGAYLSCHDQPREPVSGSATPSADRDGSSSTEAAKSAQAAALQIAQGLSKRSPDTSRASTSRQGAKVVSLRSSSPT